MSLTLFKMWNSLKWWSSKLKKKKVTENHFVSKYLLESQKYDIPMAVAFHLKLLYGFLTAKDKNKRRIDIIPLFICQVRIERLTHRRVLSKSWSFLPSTYSFVSMSYSIAVFGSSFRARESGVLNGSFSLTSPLDRIANWTQMPLSSHLSCHQL